MMMLAATKIGRGSKVTGKLLWSMRNTTHTMTNDNNTRKKASAVFFAAIMVVSMVAIGFAAAPAAADLDGTNSTIDSAAAEPVTAGFDSSEQDVQVKVTISDNASDNVTVDLSEAADVEAVPSLQDVTISPVRLVMLTSSARSLTRARTFSSSKSKVPPQETTSQQSLPPSSTTSAMLKVPPVLQTG